MRSLIEYRVEMNTKRPAFTLIELLVVIAIIAVLGGLVAFAMPGFQDRSRAARGASALQGWLSIARQQALRERRSYGLRFMVTQMDIKEYDTSPPYSKLVIGANVVTQCQYISSPDDFVGGALYIGDPAKSNEVTIENADFLTGSVEPEDYLEVFGGGVPHMIRFIVNQKDTTTTPPPLDKLV